MSTVPADAPAQVDSSDNTYYYECDNCNNILMSGKCIVVLVRDFYNSICRFKSSARGTAIRCGKCHQSIAVPWKQFTCMLHTTGRTCVNDVPLPSNASCLHCGVDGDVISQGWRSHINHRDLDYKCDETSPTHEGFLRCIKT